MSDRAGQPDTDADLVIRSLLGNRGRASFVVKAGAGSGKTTSLIKALAHIQRERGSELRRNGQRVACITYTEVAAAEISHDVQASELLRVSTIHSFLWDVIKPFQRDLQRWVLKRTECRISDLESKLSRARKESTRVGYERRLARAQDDQLKIPGISRFTYQAGSQYSKGILGHHDIIEAGPALITEYPLLAKIVSRRFPYIIVDESQDTWPSVVDALAFVDEVAPEEFTLAFFGDPAQMIYMTGAGNIALRRDWELVEKPENFRCPTRVLSLINTIRSGIDDLEQVGGRKILKDGISVPVEGSVDVFVLPVDERRTANLDIVRKWLAERANDDAWKSDTVGSDALQILVIEHRIAAERLGFGKLFAAFDQAPSGLDIDFREGRAWPLQIFRDFVMPLAAAWESSRDFEVMRLLRRQRPSLLSPGNAAEQLKEIKCNVRKLATFARSSESTIGEMLRFIYDVDMASIDDRLIDLLDKDSSGGGGDEESYLNRIFETPSTELWSYQRYVEKLSPYATHQGVKGEEFPKVLVVLDDEGSNYSLFSYEKLFGFSPLSDTDRRNIGRGAESVLDRTRRLLYVCCSRATESLVLVIYTSEVDQAFSSLKSSNDLKGATFWKLSDLV